LPDLRHKDDEVHQVICQTSFSGSRSNLPFQQGFFSVTLRARVFQSSSGLKMQLSSAILPLRISLISIDTLRPHEEVIDALVHRLAEDVRSQNEVRDPLIAPLRFSEGARMPFRTVLPPRL
jgi:hypothetical protein